MEPAIDWTLAQGERTAAGAGCVDGAGAGAGPSLSGACKKARQAESRGVHEEALPVARRVFQAPTGHFTGAGVGRLEGSPALQRHPHGLLDTAHHPGEGRGGRDKGYARRSGGRDGGDKRKVGRGR